MSRRQNTQLWMSLLCAGLVLALASSARSEPDVGGEPWAMSLAAQIKAEKRCDVQVTYFVRELPSQDGTLYSGRLRCIDGREFDFSQAKPHLKFDIKACEPAAC